MIDSIKSWLVNVGLTKAGPIAIANGLTIIGGFAMAHAGMLAQYGVNYIDSWDASWLATHAISGHVLLIELDTTGIAMWALIGAAVTGFFRGGEHHVAVTVKGLPQDGSKPVVAQ
jgi:hypothetical protein